MTVNEAYLYTQDLLNKISSNAGSNLPKHSFVRHYNATQLQWVEDRVKLSETNRIRIDELQPIMKPKKLIPKKKDNYWESTLPEDYFHYVRSYSESGCCQISLWPVREGNMNVILKDSNWMASLEWEEAPCTLIQNTIRVYADFPIKQIELIYYRFPVDINMSDMFLDVKGQVTVDVDPEFTGSSLVEILTLTARNIAGITADQLQYQVNQAKSQQHT